MYLLDPSYMRKNILFVVVFFFIAFILYFHSCVPYTVKTVFSLVFVAISIWSLLLFSVFLYLLYLLCIYFSLGFMLFLHHIHFIVKIKVNWIKWNIKNGDIATYYHLSVDIVYRGIWEISKKFYKLKKKQYFCSIYLGARNWSYFA